MTSAFTPSSSGFYKDETGGNEKDEPTLDRLIVGSRNEEVSSHISSSLLSPVLSSPQLKSQKILESIQSTPAIVSMDVNEKDDDDANPRQVSFSSFQNSFIIEMFPSFKSSSKSLFPSQLKSNSLKSSSAPVLMTSSSSSLSSSRRRRRMISSHPAAASYWHHYNYHVNNNPNGIPSHVDPIHESSFHHNLPHQYQHHFDPSLDSHHYYPHQNHHYVDGHSFHPMEGTSKSGYQISAPNFISWNYRN